MTYSTIAAALGGAMIASALVTAAVAQGGRYHRMGPPMSFAELDQNGDGILTADDLDAMHGARFAAVDTDGDGQVSEAEFVVHATAQAAERAAEMFARLDADGDGSLSRDALEARQGGRGGQMLSRAIDRFDADGDGGLSEEEFAEMRGLMEARHGGFGPRGKH